MYLYIGLTNFILPCSLANSNARGIHESNSALMHSLNHLQPKENIQHNDTWYDFNDNKLERDFQISKHYF